MEPDADPLLAAYLWKVRGISCVLPFARLREADGHVAAAGRVDVRDVVGTDPKGWRVSPASRACQAGGLAAGVRAGGRRVGALHAGWRGWTKHPRLDDERLRDAFARAGDVESGLVRNMARAFGKQGTVKRDSGVVATRIGSRGGHCRQTDGVAIATVARAGAGDAAAGPGVLWRRGQPISKDRRVRMSSRSGVPSSTVRA